MQSIRTYFLRPTNHRCSRVVARSVAGKVTLPWDCGKTIQQNHYAAAKALIRKLDWTHGTWYSGWTEDGGYVFVMRYEDAKLEVK